MNNDNLGGIGDPMALQSHEANEALEEHRYEGFEYELETLMESSQGFIAGSKMISDTYKEWCMFCEDNGYDPSQVPMLKEFSEGFLKMTGDTP